MPLNRAAFLRKLGYYPYNLSEFDSIKLTVYLYVYYNTFNSIKFNAICFDISFIVGKFVGK